MKSKLIKIFLFVLFFGYLSFGNVSVFNVEIEKKVCAAGEGVSCIPTESDCGGPTSGKINFYRAIENGSIDLVDFSAREKSTFLTSIRTQNPRYLSLCIDNTITEIMKVAYSQGEAPTGSQYVVGMESNYNMVARVCTDPNTVIQKIGVRPELDGLEAFYDYGCCRTADVLVPRTVITFANQLYSQDDYNSTYGFVQCGYRDPGQTFSPNFMIARDDRPRGGGDPGYTGTVIITDSRTGARIDPNASVGGSINFSEIGSNISVVVIQPVSESEFYSGSIRGSSLLTGAGLVTEQAVVGAASICPTTSDCAVVSNSTCLADGTCTDIGGGQFLIDPSILADPARSSYACVRCYSDDETIMTTDTQILTCDGANPRVLKPAPLVNDDVGETEACLRAGDPSSPTTAGAFQDCAQCRERGGVWVALGCIDTTPVGIITGIIRIAFGIMGGVALIQLIIAGIYYQMGNEEKVKEARKNIIATITGLAVLTFSILILRILGINFLDILPVGSI